MVHTGYINKLNSALFPTNQGVKCLALTLIQAFHFTGKEKKKNLEKLGLKVLSSQQGDLDHDFNSAHS